MKGEEWKQTPGSQRQAVSSMSDSVGSRHLPGKMGHRLMRQGSFPQDDTISALQIGESDVENKHMDTKEGKEGWDKLGD